MPSDASKGIRGTKKRKSRVNTGILSDFMIGVSREESSGLSGDSSLNNLAAFQSLKY